MIVIEAIFIWQMPQSGVNLLQAKENYETGIKYDKKSGPGRNRISFFCALHYNRGILLDVSIVLNTLRCFCKRIPRQTFWISNVC